jgi:hypothetical protein
MTARIRSVIFYVLSALTVSATFATCTHNSTPTAPSPVTMVVTGTVPTIGQSSQLTATITLSDGNKQDVTSQATWASSSPATATVSGSGFLTVLTLGASTITATYQGTSGTLSVSLQLASISVTGPTSLTVAQQYQFTTTAGFSDNSTQDVTALATWTTNGSGFLRVSSQGLVTPLVAISGLPAPGLSVSAYYLGRTGQSAALTIIDPNNSTSARRPAE